MSGRSLGRAGSGPLDYLTSLLQCFFSFPGLSQDCHKYLNPEERPAEAALAAVLDFLAGKDDRHDLSQEQAADAVFRALTDSFGWGQEELGARADAEYMLTGLTEAIGLPLKKALSFELAATIHCSGCGDSNHLAEGFTSLSASILGKTSIVEALEPPFKVEETIEGHRCAGCGAGIEPPGFVERGQRLLRVGPVLCVALGRLEYDPQRRKIDDEVDIPDEIAVRVDDPGAAGDNNSAQASLCLSPFAAVMHSGTAEQGTYAAVVQSPDTGDWWKFSGDTAEPCDAQDLQGFAPAAAAATAVGHPAAAAAQQTQRYLPDLVFFRRSSVPIKAARSQEREE
jgi:Ubiquitin carboxyl-terminal hydrolase